MFQNSAFKNIKKTIDKNQIKPSVRSVIEYPCQQDMEIWKLNTQRKTGILLSVLFWVVQSRWVTHFL